MGYFPAMTLSFYNVGGSGWLRYLNCIFLRYHTMSAEHERNSQKEAQPKTDVIFSVEDGSVHGLYSFSVIEADGYFNWARIARPQSMELLKAHQEFAFFYPEKRSSLGTSHIVCSSFYLLASLKSRELYLASLERSSPSSPNTNFSNSSPASHRYQDDNR